jgi:hypothetical protein
MSRVNTALRKQLKAALTPGALGYLAAALLYFAFYWPVIVRRFGDGAPVLAAGMALTVLVWHVAAAGRGNRALFLWAGLAPMAGASLGYLAISLLFVARHGQFVGGHGIGQWLPNVLLMAGFVARAWILSFLLLVWATILYVARAER